MEFIVGGHPQSIPMRFFGLPSSRWIFENDLASSWKGASTFIGVERDASVYKNCLAWMPGRGVSQLNIPLRNDGVIDFSESSCARIARISCSTFVGMGRSDFLSSCDRLQFIHDFKKWTCVWLDFTSQLCGDVEFILPRVGAYCTIEDVSVPIAVTLMKGREQPGISAKILSFGDRAAYVAALLNLSFFRRFEFSHLYEHTSSKTPMITVFGHLRLLENGGRFDERFSNSDGIRKVAR